PDSAKRIYKVGDFSNPSLERILSLKPDLVIVSLPEQMRIKNQLEKFRVNVFTTSPETLEDIYQEIMKLGRIIKQERPADSIVAYMQSNIKPVNRGKKKVKVYVEISARPLITIGGESFLNELIEMAGGENIFSDLKKDYPVISQEQIIAKNPEVIIILHPEKIDRRIGWNKITAIRNKKVYEDLNQDWLMRPGPRLVLGFEQLEKVFE
ncbi:MAG: helical backbone metal receptor, partial [candidate division WOR-3 bacterium]